MRGSPTARSRTEHRRRRSAAQRPPRRAGRARAGSRSRRTGSSRRTRASPGGAGAACAAVAPRARADRVEVVGCLVSGRRRYPPVPPRCSLGEPEPSSRYGTLNVPSKRVLSGRTGNRSLARRASARAGEVPETVVASRPSNTSSPCRSANSGSRHVGRAADLVLVTGDEHAVLRRPGRARCSPRPAGSRARTKRVCSGRSRKRRSSRPPPAPGCGAPTARRARHRLGHSTSPGRSHGVPPASRRIVAGVRRHVLTEARRDDRPAHHR